MTQLPIDGLARTLGSQDRRASLKSLALGFAALGAAPLAASGKSRADRGDKKKCKQQVGQCIEAISSICDRFEDSAARREDVAECCAPCKPAMRASPSTASRTRSTHQCEAGCGMPLGQDDRHRGAWRTSAAW